MEIKDVRSGVPRQQSLTLLHRRDWRKRDGVTQPCQRVSQQICFRGRRELQTTAFCLSQHLDHLESLQPASWPYTMGSMFTLLRNPNWENWNLIMVWVHKGARGVLPFA